MGKFLAMLGSIVAATGTVACGWLFMFDEPKMPKFLIEK